MPVRNIHPNGIDDFLAWFDPATHTVDHVEPRDDGTLDVTVTKLPTKSTKDD